MVSANVLQRTFRVRYGPDSGTCFTVDLDGRQYIITARHLISNVTGETQVQILHDRAWKNLPCTVVGVGEGEVDVAVLAPSHAISPAHPLSLTTNNLYLSQDVFFLGFPYGLSSDVGALNADFPIPLVKKGCVSLLATFGPGPKYVLIDGHNNPGFSGGPVVYALHGQLGATNVAGVVSSYKFEWHKVYSNQQETNLTIQYNTGIVVAYSIEHAVELVRANPIGPPIERSDA